MADKEEKNVMAMCMPYNDTPNVSNSLMEENMILMAEAKARAEAEAKAKARAEAKENDDEKPQMRSIDPYDDEKKEKKNDKKLEKLKKIYGF